MTDLRTAAQQALREMKEIPYDSICIESDKYHGLRATFSLKGKPMFWMALPMPNFAAGESLTISGFTPAVTLIGGKP